MYSTVHHCSATCCCLKASSYQCTAQHSTALRHAAASRPRRINAYTVQHCSTTCCCLRLRCINVQHSTALLYDMLLPQASLYQCTAQYSTAVPHAAASDLVLSMYSTVQYSTAVRHAAASGLAVSMYSTVLPCSTTCGRLRLRCIDA